MKAGRTRMIVSGCAAALALAAAVPSSASPDRKMDRQIELFERILDDVLVESPNWLVRTSEEARGRYRSGEGVRFRFDASLVGSGHGISSWWSGWGGGKRVIVIGEDGDLEDIEEIEKIEKKERQKDEKSLGKQMKRDERLYGRGKTELIDAILDYGELLTAVPDGEWLIVEVDLGRATLFEEKDLSTLTIKAKMGDVRAWADGKIDEKVMVSRIVLDES